MKRWMCGWLFLWGLAAMAAVGYGQSILWVSDCGTEETPHDQPYIELLVEEGYTVDRLTEPRVMDEAKRDLCNTYDLIIVGRHGDSGQFASNADEVLLWNSITAPMINMNAYLWRNSRWKWVDSGATANTADLMQIDALDDSLFNGVTPDENGQVDIVASGNVALCTQANSGNGELLGHRANAGSPHVWMAYWETGLEFYVGAGQTAGGPRLAYAAAESGGAGDGSYNITETGKTILLNAVYEMSGATFDRKPSVTVDSGLIVYKGNLAQVNGSVFDPEGAVTIAWSQVSGPGAVTFDDSSMISPTVSFSAKGTYELLVTVTDTANTVTATLTAHVRDHADDALIAHYDFESLPEPNSLVDVSGNGLDGVWHTFGTLPEPNMVAGHITGSSKAVAFGGESYWEIPNGYTNDPNFGSLRTGATIAAWVNMAKTINTNYPMIIGNGLNGWRFQVNANRWNFAYQPGGIDVFGTYPPMDGFWHHVVAVYDGVNSKARLYVDGFLNAEVNTARGVLLSEGTAYPQVQIGNRGDGPRLWPGLIDDIAVYNYALSDEAIAQLAEAGDRQLYMTAGEDQTVQFRGEAVPMEATLFVSDGIPAATALTWSVVSVPLGADPANVVFSDPAAEDPMVSFPPIAGTYVLSLTADDTTQQITDEVSVVIVVPSCADAIADGHGLVTDLNADCYVNLVDLALMASDWMRCYNPTDALCEWPY